MLTEPTLYRIRVKGSPGASCAMLMTSMSVAAAVVDGVPMAEMVGPVHSQEALIALLMAIYNNGMCLLSAEQIAAPPIPDQVAAEDVSVPASTPTAAAP